MSLFDRYGIKEVADVTFYELNEENPGVPGKPVLYLDTLKVSTVDQTAENTEARGGKGNAALMTWDYGKEIILNLEDALFSMKSMEVMYGSNGQYYGERKFKLALEEDLPFFLYHPAGYFPLLVLEEENPGSYWGNLPEYINEQYPDILSNIKTLFPADYSRCMFNGQKGELTLRDTDNNMVTLWINSSREVIPKDKLAGFADLDNAVETFEIGDGAGEYKIFSLLAGVYELEFIPSSESLKKISKVGWNENDIALNDISTKTMCEIDISANTFPGTYYVTADTFARNELTGKDEMFQLILPKVKLLSETNTITMEAEGDPTVFNMSLKVLKPKEGAMMSLIQYEASDRTFIDIDYHCINPGGPGFSVLTELLYNNTTIYSTEIFEFDKEAEEWFLPDEQGLFIENNEGFV